MTFPQTVLVFWLIFSALPLWGGMVAALIRIRMALRRNVREDAVEFPPVELIVPVKGAFPEHETALKSLLQQTYPAYHVLFILETETDPANTVVDELHVGSPHSRKVVSGLCDGCAQKNHNLVEAAKRLRSETEILVFCDSTNVAHPRWLDHLTRAVRSGECDVMTTFRAFDPQPRTVGGVCQAMYAAFLLLLAINRPTPWGGATAIRRSAFDRLKVVDAWSGTIVDDLVLGNVLAAAGVPVNMDPTALLESPLRGQSVPGFLSYLDRQILFPKFTNPGMWIQATTVYLNLTAAVSVSFVLGIASSVGWVTPFTGWCGGAFLASMLAFVCLLRQFNPFAIPWRWWLLSFAPCLFLTGFIFVRSLVRNHIDWHGKRYWAGKGGAVLKVEPVERK